MQSRTVYFPKTVWTIPPATKRECCIRGCTGTVIGLTRTNFYMVCVSHKGSVMDDGSVLIIGDLDKQCGTCNDRTATEIYDVGRIEPQMRRIMCCRDCLPTFCECVEENDLQATRHKPRLKTENTTPLPIVTSAAAAAGGGVISSPLHLQPPSLFQYSTTPTPLARSVHGK